MVRDRRPSDIRPLENLIEKEATDKQEDVIDVIKDNPEMPFKDMAELGPEKYDTAEYTGSHYSDVFYKYFGPGDDEFRRSFKEVKERYGTLKNYYENRYDLDDLAESKSSESEQVPLDARELLSDERIELSGEIYDAIKLGIKIGFEQGYKIGREDRQKRD